MNRYFMMVMVIWFCVSSGDVSAGQTESVCDITTVSSESAGDVSEEPTESASNPSSCNSPAFVAVKDFSPENEGNLIIKAAAGKAPAQKIKFISAYFLGRKYRPDTRTRIKKQRKAEKSKRVKTEADNKSPLPVKVLATGFQYLDCMTYVEHVLALAATDIPSDNGRKLDSSDTEAAYSLWRRGFLNRLIDIMFNAQGKPLMNHMRNHFVSVWAENNCAKGYITDVAKENSLGKVRSVILNKVKDNRTFYVEDSFMISSGTTQIHYFDIETLLTHREILHSGDILALVCEKEGLDVVHMGFYIKKLNKTYFRHASWSDNRIVDSDFADYFKKKTSIVGLMVLRPVLRAPVPPAYQIVNKSAENRTDD